MADIDGPAKTGIAAMPGAGVAGAASDAKPNSTKLLILLFLAYVCSGLDRLIMPLMVGPVKQSLGINDLQVGLLQGVAFGLCYAIAGVPLGWLVDRVRRTWLLAFGILLWSFMTIFCGLASSFLMLFLARMGLGLTEATLAPSGYSLIGDSFKRRHLVRANAIFASGAYVSIGFSYFVAGLVIDYLNSKAAFLKTFGLEPWQATFIVIALPGLLLVPALMAMPEPPRGERVQATGIGETLKYIWGRRRDYGPFYFASVLLGVPTYSGMNWFPTHVMRFFGTDPKSTGILVGSLQVAAAFTGTFVGTWLTEYFVRRNKPDAHLRTIVIISTLILIGMAGPLMPMKWAALAFWFVAVIGFSAYFPTCMGALQIMTPSNMRGSNTALIMMCSVLGGQVAGTALVGALSDHLFPGVSYGIGRSLAMCGVIAALASLFMALRARPHFAMLMQREEYSLHAPGR